MSTKTKNATKRGVGTAAREALKKGMTNEEALAAAKKEFPNAKTSLASINWYRNQLRAEGASGVKTARDLTKSRKKKAGKNKDPLDG